MSTVRVEAAGQESIDRATKMLSGVEGGLQKALREAMTRATSKLRTASAAAIRERYAISTADIRANENVTVQYNSRSGVQAWVTFSGNKIPLFRYDGASPTEPTPDTSHRVPAPGSEGWRLMYPGVAASGRQLKSTSPRKFQDAFVAGMASGHTGIFERTGGKTSAGLDEIQEIMGSSVPQMLGNKETQEKLSKKAMEDFEARLDHNVMAILSGYMG